MAQIAERRRCLLDRGDPGRERRGEQAVLALFIESFDECSLKLAVDADDWLLEGFVFQHGRRAPFR